MSSILITVTLPLTRVDGSALAPADLASVTIFKAVGPAPAAVLTTINSPATDIVTFTDNAPDAGQDDTYTATVTDTKGNTSAPSGAVTVSVPVAVLAVPSAPSLTAVLQ